MIKTLSEYKIKTGVKGKYKQKWNYPISTSTSVKIAQDYANFPMVSSKNKTKDLYARKIVVKFVDIKAQDVVVDTRLLQKLSTHSAQTEIILDSRSTYSIMCQNFVDLY